MIGQLVVDGSAERPPRAAALEVKIASLSVGAESRVIACAAGGGMTSTPAAAFPTSRLSATSESTLARSIAPATVAAAAAESRRAGGIVATVGAGAGARFRAGHDGAGVVGGALTASAVGSVGP